MASNNSKYQGMAMNISENNTTSNQDSLSQSNFTNPEKQRKTNLSDPSLSDEFMMTDQLISKQRSQTGDSQDQYTLYKYRWLELTLYSFCTAMNQVCWISLQPIAGAIENGYGFGSVIISSIGVTFMAIYIVVNFPANYAMDKLGLKLGILIGVTLSTIGMCLKVLVNVSFYYVMVG